MSGTFLGTGLGGGFFPAAAAASPVTPPAPTSEAVAAGGAVTGWTFGAFTDPDGRIASYSATLTAVVGSGSLSGSGLGPYSITGTADGDGYTVELDALDSDGAVLATATHSVNIGSAGAIAAGDWVAGGSVLLDGVDEFINLGEQSAFDFDPATDSFSISFWTKDANVTSNVVIGNWFGGATLNDRDGWLVNLAGSQLLLVFGNGASFTLSGPTKPTLTQWVHVLITWDTTTHRTYYDGVAQTSYTPSHLTPPYTQTTKVYVGASQVTASTEGGYTTGSLMQVAVWSSDQSANVADIYNGGNLHDYRDLATPPDLLYMPMSVYGDSATATDGFSDLSGNGYDGTGVRLEAADLKGSSAEILWVYTTDSTGVGP